MARMARHNRSMTAPVRPTSTSAMPLPPRPLHTDRDAWERLHVEGDHSAAHVAYLAGRSPATVLAELRRRGVYERKRSAVHVTAADVDAEAFWSNVDRTPNTATAASPSQARVAVAQANTHSTATA